jgi:Carboxypeptidase regulatory-like domain
MTPLLVAALLLQTGAVPAPRDVGRPPASGTASISGRITDAETGRPLARALVTVHMTDGTSDEITADLEGRYAFVGLAAGKYVVEAGPGRMRASHLPQCFGATRPRTISTTPGPWIALGAGEVRADVDVALSRSLAVAGRVLGPDGEPLANVTVVAEPVWRRLFYTSVTTDDRGAFRVYGLPPGSYRVCADPHEMHTLSPAGDNERYVRTCAPGGVLDSDAELFALSRDPVTDVEIRLQRRHMSAVSGTVIDASGGSVQSARVTVRSLDRPDITASDDVRQGQFVVRGLPPGRYSVTATVGMPWPPGPGTHQARDYEAGTSTFELDGADATGVVVALAKTSAVNGRVVFEGDRPGPGAVKMKVLARDTDRVRSPYEPRVQPLADVAADLTFSLSGLFGPHVFVALGAPAGWVMKAIRYRGRDILDVPTSLPPGNDGAVLEIVLTDRVADVSARVVGPDGHPTTALVAVVPTDRSRWQFFGRGWSPEQPATGDVTHVGLFAPGEYFVAALSDEDYSSLLDYPEALDPFAAVARRITLTEGQKLTLDLRLVSLDGVR